MSVINKMLRDLDQRQPVPAADAAPGGTDALLRQGTSSVPAAAGSRGGAAPRRWLAVTALLCVVAAAGGAAWWWQAGEPKLAGLGLPGGAGPAEAVRATVAAAPSVEAVASAGDTSVSGSVVLRMESSLSARRALDALLSSTPPPKPVPAPTSVPVAATTPPLAVASKPSTPAVAGTRTAAAASAPVGDSTPIVQRQQQAGGDALAQAQSLWASGLHDAATDLLQQSIGVVERAAKGAGSTGANPVLLPMVREMARMQLAEGRHGAVWEMLTRLEPLLGNQADLWAIRANAAQRLGRHPDSVHAYMMALQLRPDEQRWVLGAAVSLAALGQTGSAAEMADKARALGPVSKEILAFLRQAGVQLRD